MSNSEQRDNTRFPHVSKLTDEDLGKGVQSGSKMFNYSENGLYFESDLLLQAGEKIFIGIDDSPYADESGVYECYHALVKWRKDLDASEYKHGYSIQFYDPEASHTSGVYSGKTSEAQLAERDVEIAKDFRKHERKELSKTINCFSEGRSFKARITDISPSGAFIETEEPFEIGQKFSVALPFLNNKDGAMVKAKVMHKNDKGIGVKFIKLKNKKV